MSVSQQHAEREESADQPDAPVPAAELRRVHKYFGSNHVLKGVDLTVPRGRNVVIFGPSGSGRSTLLRTINLLERPQSGSASELAGYDVDLVTILAEDRQGELEISDQEFDPLIPGLLSGLFDMVSVGLVGRPERLEQMWFTCPYVPYRQVVVINNESGITSLDDLNSANVTITALVGSTAANLVSTTSPDTNLVELEQQPAFLEGASGRADAIVVEEYLALPFTQENEGTSILNPDQPFQQEYGSVSRGEVVWLEYLNGWFRYYISSGTLDRMYTDIIGPTEGLPPC